MTKISKERREFREYLRSLSDEEFRKLLEDAGFEVEEGNGEFVNMEESE